MKDAKKSQAPKAMKKPKQPKEKEKTTARPPLKRTFDYMSFKDREPPPMKGQKEIPTGAPGCLIGTHFLITGVLESLEREEATDLIKSYGGDVHKSFVKKLTHLLMGSDPGPSKVEKAQSNPQVKVINEDELFDMIRNSAGKELSKEQQQKLKKKPPKPTQFQPVVTPSEQGPATKKKKKVTKKEAKEEEMLESSLSQPIDQNILWTEKYRPTTTKDLVANPGVIDKLRKWLQEWKQGQGPSVKAALISGAPGIGKTTAARVLVEEEGFEPIEFNASDTRSRTALHDHLKEITGSKTISGYFKKKEDKGPTNYLKGCLIMDEVDGMSTGDRGGIAELIQFIKVTHIPVICICNDRKSPKIRNLANYCLDLSFRRPTVQQAVPRLTKIAQLEGFSGDISTLERIFESVHGDIRQAINILQMWRRGNNNLHFNPEIKEKLAHASKDMDIGAFDVVPRLFSQPFSLSDKLSYYYVDASLIPLMVQENYLSVTPSSSQPSNRDLLRLESVAQAAESISAGNVAETMIRRGQHWDLSNTHAVFSTVLPTTEMRGYLHARINFPSWLGKNSSATKKERELQELHTHTRSVIRADRNELQLYYLPLLREKLTRPLIEEGTDGINVVIETMDEYDLMRDDWDFIMDLSQYKMTHREGGEEGELESKDVTKLIPTQVKAAFTRAYNAHSHALKVARSGKRSSKKSRSEVEEEQPIVNPNERIDLVPNVGTSVSESEEEDIQSDRMISQGKKPSKQTKTNKNKKEPEKKETKKEEETKKKEEDEPVKQKKLVRKRAQKEKEIK